MIRKIIEAWNHFFFTPTSPAALGIFRITFGFVIFLATLGRYPYRELFYGDHGIVTRATMDHYFAGPDFLYFRWLPAGDPWLNLYFLGFMLVIWAFILGWQTRTMSVLVWAGLMSLSNRNFFIDNAGDDLMRINCFFLMFCPAGAAYSIDRWLRVHRGEEKPGVLPLHSPWGQRLLQLQVAYLYFDTAVLKLPGEGWQDGTAMYYALNYLELRRFDLKFLFYYLWQIKIMTYSVIVGEFGLSLLIWFRRFRYWMIAIGIGLHIGINLTMQFPIFQYVMITSLFNFFYPEDVERVVNAVSKRWSRRSLGLAPAP